MSFRSPSSTIVALLAGLALAGPAGAAPARLVIPRLGLDLALTANLADGPQVFYRDADTIAIAAHRTTHTHPFLHLPNLRRGDAIAVAGIGYRVRKTVIVRPWQTWVLRYRGVVLSACYPAGSAAYRIVVLAAPAD